MKEEKSQDNEDPENTQETKNCSNYAKGHKRAPNKDHLIALDQRKRQQERQDTQET